MEISFLVVFFPGVAEGPREVEASSWKVATTGGDADTLHMECEDAHDVDYDQPSTSKQGQRPKRKYIFFIYQTSPFSPLTSKLI